MLGGITRRVGGQAAKALLSGGPMGLAFKAARAGARRLDPGGMLGPLAEQAAGTAGRAGEAVRDLAEDAPLPIHHAVDVAVPIERAYELWMERQDFPSAIDRRWVAEITDDRPGELVSWRSVDGPHNTGFVTFHPTAPRLTRVELTLDFRPDGLIERTASALGVADRKALEDLRRFKAFAEAREATGGRPSGGRGSSGSGSRRRRSDGGRRQERSEAAGG